ncbi:MAG: flagellar motor protein MotA [Chromatiaceae bacterium]|nr:flagellar motor protein MotA [Gammaproteobacteria bacterium]MCP5318431.1 flagellar motor protein MotA [Chromatiaceae bacterium]MCP5430981.1 flagellar motor protein MotA [Chromatiaceae bacterium]MCW5585018.1 flagellar motor protein MotA [Chromatiales bacterium]HOP16180.1 flagellar motor protein MotA [Gammaproteobacteria bacterium]
MLSTRQSVFWMVIYLAIVATVCVLLAQPLRDAFMANWGFNAVILGVLAVGILINFRQVLVLNTEINWIRVFRSGQPGISVTTEPRLLKPLAAHLGKRRRDRFSLSALALRTILDGIRERLDESREISRYLIGTLIFLGLLGTFWGLLGTIAAVGQVIDGLEVGSGDFAGVFAELKRGLQAPLGGMGTAFSSSLFGLGGSLVLGFLDLQAGHAQNRFFNGLEEWLSGVTQLVDDLGVPPLATATLAEPALAEPALAEPTPSGEPDDATLRLLIETIRSERQLIEALLTRHAAPLAAEPDRPEA